jgi:two-component system, OmpR family, phosphate regulon sensor histidine kinase PhoR
MLRILNLLWNKRAFALRGLFCWLVGLGFLLSDYNGDFDLRFSVRPNQSKDPRIVLLITEPEDWGAGKPGLVRQEAVEQMDGVFWRSDPWQHLIKTIMLAEPLSVGVSFFFAQAESSVPLLQNPKVIWAARIDSEGRALLPGTSKPYGLNTGVIDFVAGADGVVRRLSSPLVHIPPIALRIVEKATGRDAYLPFGYRPHINFRGDRGSFPSIRYRDLMTGKIAAKHLKGKIVIIGSENLSTHQVLTPVGFMTRAELVATTVDNILGKRWITKLNVEVYGIYLFAILLLTVWIILGYPQSVSTLFLGGLGVILTALSIWTFDAFYVWVPVSAPLIQIAVTFIVFLSFQLSVNEQKAWRLEQEKKYFLELEQLKSNFLSLFSHDLKTPIAKMQAILDRVLSIQKDPVFEQDLKSLKKTSQELHRYIHSILQLSRVEARELKINKEPVDVNELIEKAVDQILPLAFEKQIQIKKNLEPLFSLELDSVLVGEVILNLVDNAVKYSPAGSFVKVSSKEDNDEVIITVSDNGPGIPADKIKHIWEKFYRAGESVEAKGSGLGLYLVKYFIELHGGRVFVNSHPGLGTETGFVLPIADIEGAFENA